MNVRHEFLDITILDEGFTLSALWLFREQLKTIWDQVEDEKVPAMISKNVQQLKDLERQQFFIDRNIQSIECLMVNKEEEVFEEHIYETLCLN